jgi:TonB family protein
VHRGRLLITILVAVLPLRGYGECASDPARIKLALPPEALAIRNALFSQLCADGSGELVDVTDPTLAGRLDPPGGLELSNRDPNTKGLRGTVLLAFLVDVDGSLHQITVLESSGYPQLDNDAVRYFGYLRFKRAAKLDGKPVRALTYFKMPFKVK